MQTSVAQAINASGFVVGSSQVAGGNTHAFIKVPDSGPNMAFFDLSTLGGTYSAAYGINSFNQVVGTATLADGSYRAVLYLPNDGILHDLNEYLSPGAGWLLQTANAINNAGQITGWGYHNGLARAYRLIPQ